MTIRATRGLVEEWFTPKDELEEDDPTRFKLRPLNQIDLLEVMSEGIVRDDGSFLPTHRGRMILLRKGVVDWENFADESDKPIGFNREGLVRVPAEILNELGNEIMTRSMLQEDEKKT